MKPTTTAARVRVAPFVARAVLVACALPMVLGLAACSDEGTTTSCEDMPLIDRDGGFVDPSQDPDYSDWRRDAVREGCATPSGDPDDFEVD